MNKNKDPITLTKENKISELYLKLLGKYGSAEKFWPQWCGNKKTAKERELIAIGAILTQRTSWRNAHLALLNLKKKNILSLKKIALLRNLKKLTALIKPAGFYRSKPGRLFRFCSFIVKNFGNLNNFARINLNITREKLLSLNGIGPETADTILLYALDKPTFVIDEYTKRMSRKEKLTRKLNYNYLKKFFEKNLPSDFKIYQDFHALIIIDQKGEQASKMDRI